MSKTGSMNHVATYRLKKMSKFGRGRSKHRDKQRNGGKPLLCAIYANNTYRRYTESICLFLRWVEFNFGCRHLDEARQCVAAYLDARIIDGLSPSTLHTDASAIAKLYQCSYSSFGVKLPPRRRADRIKNKKAATINIAEWL